MLTFAISRTRMYLHLRSKKPPVTVSSSQEDPLSGRISVCLLSKNITSFRTLLLTFHTSVIISRRYAPGVPPGNESYRPEEAVHLIQYNTSLATKLLGIQYRTKEETTKDILEDFKEKGWWPKRT